MNAHAWKAKKVRVTPTFDSNSQYLEETLRVDAGLAVTGYVQVSLFQNSARIPGDFQGEVELVKF